ncbi:MAG: nucleotidyltransferase family protein [Cyclobacteriaceae bacterium]
MLSIDKIKEIAVSILKAHGVSQAGVFGSYARAQADDQSDIDILVRLSIPMSLLDFARIKLSLEDALHAKVDLVEHDALKSSLRGEILREEIPILNEVS